ncbi:hypothetical protein [Mycobacterium gallinarum]|uniref:hypothetical protein n=1 Tax=Mycobacterium gallinarum TaxID=39689 RepID=UPI0013CFB35A|nr:hypothetical protein [Mycobacterium gallinarum]
MKSALSVSCGGPRWSWDRQPRALQRGRLARRWIVAALLLALGLVVVALLMADPTSTDLAVAAGLSYF